MKKRYLKKKKVKREIFKKKTSRLKRNLKEKNNNFFRR